MTKCKVADRIGTMYTNKSKKRRVAARLRRAVRSGAVTREQVMGATMRGRRAVDYWLSGKFLPPETVCAAIESVCGGAS